MTFGIPQHLVPFTSDYKIKTKNHLEYLAMRKTAENFATGPCGGSIATTDLPSNVDLLLGEGKPIQEYRGNQRLSAIIDDYVDEYHAKSKQEKTALAVEMVQKVKAARGRFLSKESGIWIEVSDDLARDKVSHMFRHQRRKANRKEREVTDNQSTIHAVDTIAKPKCHMMGIPSSKRFKV